MDILTGELRDKWNDLLNVLRAEQKESWQLAGLFKGYLPRGYLNRTHRILYIGKATAGPFVAADANRIAFGRRTAGFWSFAREISGITMEECADLGNLAWSNLCKIGVRNGNPDDTLAERQRELAVKTLQLEMEFLQPTLIVCVAEGFQDHFVYEALGVTQDLDDGFRWRQAGRYSIYFREAQDGWPPIMWMKHPERKKRIYLDEALSIAEALIRGRAILSQ